MEAPDSDILSLARAVETCCRVKRSVGHGSTRAARDHFDIYRLASSPALLRALAELMATLLPPQTEVLGGLDLGGLPIATVMSQVTGLPGVLVRLGAGPTAASASSRASIAPDGWSCSSAIPCRPVRSFATVSPHFGSSAPR